MSPDERGCYTRVNGWPAPLPSAQQVAHFTHLVLLSRVIVRIDLKQRSMVLASGGRSFLVGSLLLRVFGISPTTDRIWNSDASGRVPCHTELKHMTRTSTAI